MQGEQYSPQTINKVVGGLIFYNGICNVRRYLDDTTNFTKTPTDKLLYRWRKETTERSFTDAKVLQGTTKAFGGLR